MPGGDRPGAAWGTEDAGAPGHAGETTAMPRCWQSHGLGHGRSGRGGVRGELSQSETWPVTFSTYCRSFYPINVVG